jgi:para-aminobenzoate synthetase component 1
LESLTTIQRYTNMNTRKYSNKLESNYKTNDIIQLYSKVKTLYNDTSILESLNNPNTTSSRYTIMGVIPNEKLTILGTIAHLTNCANNTSIEVDYKKILNSWIKPIANCSATAFQIGVIGYIGYEMKHHFEELVNYHKKDTNSHDLYLVKYSLLHITDNTLEKSYWIFDNSLTIDRVKSIITSIENTPIQVANFKSIDQIKHNFTKLQYLDSINKTINYIREGDIFQANITMRFQGKYSGTPFKLYETLRQTTPNPFFAYLDFEMPIISTSPERFFKIETNKIYTYPIKGTVKCEINGIDQKDTLLNSQKDRSENIMITDLLRNDIGKFCKQGTVNVTELCGIRQFNNIYHLESVIQGELKEKTTFYEILKAMFPGGSITGAPKIRSMDIIEELEYTSRDIYTGTIGFFGTEGFIDTNIAIRSIYFDDSNYYFHAGGGITTYSDPNEEYNELLLKIQKISETIASFNEA